MTTTIATNGLLAAAMLALVACTGIEGDELEVDEASDDLEGPDAGVDEELAADQVWEWWHTVNNGAPISMGSALNRTCYLQGVGGNFDGAGEHVGVYVQNGQWWLGGDGASSSKFLYAAARCAPMTSTQEYVWVQGQPFVTMSPRATHSCFLTYVQGAFDAWSNGVHADGSGTSWVLKGSTSSHGMKAGARCVARPTLDPEYLWNKNDPPREMKPTSSHICGATKMFGAFEGSGEFFLIYPSQPSGGGNWRLGGASQQNSQQDGSRCFAR